MDVKWLQTFVSAAHRGTLGAAATQLGYSRSTITHHVQSLERSFGVPLFQRTSSGLELTVAGEKLLEHSEIVLDHLDRARTELRSDRTAQGPILRLGATESACTYRLSGLLRMINRHFRSIQMAADVGLTNDIRERFDAGQFDMILLSSLDALPTETPHRELWREPFVMVAAPGAAAMRSVLVTQPGCVYRKIVEDEYLSQVPGATLLQIGSLEAVKSGVCAGLGIGLLPLVAVRSLLARGTLVELPWRSSRHVVTGVCWNPDRCPTEVADQLWRLRGHQDEMKSTSVPTGTR